MRLTYLSINLAVQGLNKLSVLKTLLVTNDNIPKMQRAWSSSLLEVHKR